MMCKKKSSGFRRQDGVLILGILIVCAVMFAYLKIQGFGENKCIVIEQNGEELARYTFGEDKIIPITDEILFQIQNGTVQMLQSNCPDQICVSHLPISDIGESIICLPNRLVISIQERSGYEAECRLDGTDGRIGTHF
jgi:hypothetical protein